ncbi:anaerobic cobalt chelatase cbiK [Clostridium tetanomorphum]|nr:anaerobic cobalt chelatase cbiK [Clostridium tetanomorphum]
MPFMLVAGDHATNDMAGDEEDSWKSILENEGFKVNIYLHGIGENENIQKIFIQHLQDCIDGNPLIEE